MALRLFRKFSSLSALILSTGALALTQVAFSQTYDDSSPDVQEFMQKTAGRYAHYDIVAYVAKLPMIGQMRSLVITYGFSDFKVDGDKLIESDTFCHSEYKANLPMESLVDDSFTRAIIPASTPVEISQQNGQFVLYRPFTPTPIGLRMDNPDDPFPTDPNDPRITDDDHDGKPGVTVHIKFMGVKAELYIVRQERFAYTMTPGVDGKLTGVVKDESKQLVVGASMSMLKRQPAPMQHKDPALSPIILVPVDASYDCERLMQERSKLFPPNPAVWR